MQDPLIDDVAVPLICLVIRYWHASCQKTTTSLSPGLSRSSCVGLPNCNCVSLSHRCRLDACRQHPWVREHPPDPSRPLPTPPDPSSSSFGPRTPHFAPRTLHPALAQVDGQTPLHLAIELARTDPRTSAARGRVRKQEEEQSETAEGRRGRGSKRERVEEGEGRRGREEERRRKKSSELCSRSGNKSRPHPGLVL
jgi:hypothetical protein